jgi:hypothetical protein
MCQLSSESELALYGLRSFADAVLSEVNYKLAGLVAVQHNALADCKLRTFES